MFKQCVSWLIIFSLLFTSIATAGNGGSRITKSQGLEEGSPRSPRVAYRAVSPDKVNDPDIPKSFDLTEAGAQAKLPDPPKGNEDEGNRNDAPPSLRVEAPPLPLIEGLLPSPWERGLHQLIAKLQTLEEQTIIPLDKLKELQPSEPQGMIEIKPGEPFHRLGRGASFTASEAEEFDDGLGEKSGASEKWKPVEREVRFTISPREIIALTDEEEGGAKGQFEDAPLLEEKQDYSEDEDGFVHILGRQRPSVELSEAPLLGEAGEDSSALKALRELRIRPKALTSDEHKDFEKVIRVERSWWNGLLWANLGVLFSKILFAFTTNKSSVSGKDAEKKCCDPLWLSGGPVPLDDERTIKRNVIIKTFTHSFEEVVLEGIHFTLLGLFILQIVESAKAGEFSGDILQFLNFFNDSDMVGTLGIINALHKYPQILSVLATPFIYAAYKTIRNVWELSEATDESVTHHIQHIKGRSTAWDSWFFNFVSILPIISLLLNFHPMKREIPSLATRLLWEGELDPKLRGKAITALTDLAQNRRGFSQMVAIEALARIAHGMHVDNLALRKDRIQLLKIKLDAFWALQEIYKKLPYLSLNKRRTAVLLWEIGQSPSWRMTVVEPFLKFLGVALNVYTLYGICDAVIRILTCPNPYLESFEWGRGLEFASDYKKECFDAQVKVFNLLPGQPADTLVGKKGDKLLERYQFPNKTYDLDLSNKGIDGSVIAEIVEAFQDAGVMLRSLDISGNSFTNSSDIERILDALPVEIQSLNMADLSPKDDVVYSAISFLGLKNLTSLQYLDISTNSFSEDMNTVMGEILNNLFYLEEFNIDTISNLTHLTQAFKPCLRVLEISSTQFSSEDQIALGNSLAQNLTLDYLNMYFDDYVISSEGFRSLAQGLAAQHHLRVLYLGLGIGRDRYKDINILLSSLPQSLTELNVGGNYVYDTSSIIALGQAVQKMTELTSFIVGATNKLGNYPRFLKALHDKKHLTTFDLSGNDFVDTVQIRDLLETTPSLEILDLSNNQLTQGSILVPVLTTHRNLKSLNLGGNDFTTEDRIAIWNTTSFLPTLPFYLDEDLNFATVYLQSLPSNTTTLNLSGLIPNNSTAFEIIMPLVLDLFPNLEELDISFNDVSNIEPGTNIPRGIQALISYLPQLKKLQSLNISEAGIPWTQAIPYYKNISFTIGQLPNLRILDLSGSWFFYADSLGKGLEKSHSLTSINLGGCWAWGLTLDYWEGLQLIEGLQALPLLCELDLSNNWIGGSSYSNISMANATYALANALGTWTEMQFLDISSNNIGYNDAKSSLYFLTKLADMVMTWNKEGKPLNVNFLNGMQNVIWTETAQAFEEITQKSIEDECRAQVCSGKPFGNTSVAKRTKTTNKHTFEMAPVASSASRLEPFYSGWIRSVGSWLSASGEKALDSVAQSILSYSKSVVEECPSYFGGMALGEYPNQTRIGYKMPTFISPPMRPMIPPK